ncbi:MAG: RNA polymerase factor sigma-32 [Bacteroidota bacterium]
MLSTLGNPRDLHTNRQRSAALPGRKTAGAKRPRLHVVKAPQSDLDIETDTESDLEARLEAAGPTTETVADDSGQFASFVELLPEIVKPPKANDRAFVEHAEDSGGASTLGAYLNQLRRYPLMSREEEHDLAVEFARTGDPRIATRLVTSNLRLVVKLAREYRRARHNLLDLIQEGNLGLVRAVQKYDPNRGVKLSSYASWWIRAYILKSILANWRLVRVGTTQVQRKLFFNLNQEREKLERSGFQVEAKHLAAALDVSEQQVIEMERRLASETSLDAPIRGTTKEQRTAGDFVQAGENERPDAQVESGEFRAILRSKLATFQGTLAHRDLEIFQRRLLNDEPVTSVQIAHRFGISRERVRQLEERLRKKIRQYLEDEMGDAVRCA